MYRNTIYISFIFLKKHNHRPNKNYYSIQKLVSNSCNRPTPSFYPQKDMNFVPLDGRPSAKAGWDIGNSAKKLFFLRPQLGHIARVQPSTGNHPNVVERDINHLFFFSQAIVGMWKWPEATSDHLVILLFLWKDVLPTKKKVYRQLYQLVSLWHHTSWFRDWMNSSNYLWHLMCQRFFAAIYIRLMEEFLRQLIGSSSHYLQGFIHFRWCRISAINSRICDSEIEWCDYFVEIEPSRGCCFLQGIPDCQKFRWTNDVRLLVNYEKSGSSEKPIKFEFITVAVSDFFLPNFPWKFLAKAYEM